VIVADDLRQYSQGLKPWSADGERHRWLEYWIPTADIDALAQAIVVALPSWTGERGCLHESSHYACLYF
jgi:hypothetical protein